MVETEQVVAHHLEIYLRATARLDTRVLELVESLKRRYIVACLTNTEPEIGELNRRRGLYRPFQRAYLSTEIGLYKPGRAIFEWILRDLGCAGSEVVFTDDSEANVGGARAGGLHAIHYTDFDQFSTELARLLPRGRGACRAVAALIARNGRASSGGPMALGRAALVTGATRSRGIAAAIAQALARDGWGVATTGWRPFDATEPWGSRAEEAEALISVLRGLGVAAGYHEDDLGDPAAPARILDAAERVVGPLAALVNVHTHSGLGGLLDTTRRTSTGTWR